MPRCTQVHCGKTPAIARGYLDHCKLLPQRGGIIGFRREEKRLQLDINLERAEQARLTISSRGSSDPTRRREATAITA